jgi:hypothetical protein
MYGKTTVERTSACQVAEEVGAALRRGESWATIIDVCNRKATEACDSAYRHGMLDALNEARHQATA